MLLELGHLLLQLAILILQGACRVPLLLSQSSELPAGPGKLSRHRIELVNEGCQGVLVTLIINSRGILMLIE